MVKSYIAALSLCATSVFGGEMATRATEVEAPYTVELYTALFCGHCKTVKAILKEAEIDYEEHGITFGGQNHKEMLQRTGGEDGAPRIFINGHYIGTARDLAKLKEAGVVDAIARGEATTLQERYLRAEETAYHPPTHPPQPLCDRAALAARDER